MPFSSHLVATVPVSNDNWKIEDRVGVIISQDSFKNLALIWSGLEPLCSYIHIVQ